MSQVDRVMARCKTCRSWWSVRVDEISTAKCGCGGVLVKVDLAAHLETVAYIPEGEEDKIARAKAAEAHAAKLAAKK